LTSLILQTATRLLQPLLLLFSIVLLLRGHDGPGGGFVGGLAAAAAFALNAMAYGVPAARRSLRSDPRTFAGAGLVVAVVSASLSLALGRPFMSGSWTAVRLPGIAVVQVGTPLLFDVGVYLVVLGATLTIIFGLAEE
jgi:multicomponent Na+:H+ antiporter subunit B